MSEGQASAVSPEIRDPIHSEQVEFAARDATSLRGTLFGEASDASAAMIINSGTAIPRGFYRRFAAEAVSRGFVVLTYDYRGIGDSTTEPLSKSKVKYRDWGQLDVPGAIDFMRYRFPNLPLTVVGHSTGGQQLGLAPNVSEIAAALFVGVSTGYSKGMPLVRRWSSVLLFRILVPIFRLFLRYVPSSKLGLGEDLPYGVAREWGDWCSEPTYLAAFFDETGHRRSFDGAPFGATHFERADFPILAICLEDDDIATRKTVPFMLSLFRNAQIEERWISPSTYSLSSIGHLGFFRRKAGEHLWDDALRGLSERLDRPL